MEDEEIFLPIVRLIGRSILKVLYGDKKWVFKQGVDYTDVHPSFSAHLSTLKDEHGNFLFEIKHCTKEVNALPDKSIEAAQTAGNLKETIKKRAVQVKKGELKIKRRPPKLNTM